VRNVLSSATLLLFNSEGSLVLQSISSLTKVAFNPMTLKNWNKVLQTVQKRLDTNRFKRVSLSPEVAGISHNMVSLCRLSCFFFEL